jgi:dienelactone hydrolase
MSGWASGVTASAAAVCLLMLAAGAWAQGHHEDMEVTKVSATAAATAASPEAGRLARVCPDGPLPAGDERLERCRHLDMRFTMPTYAGKQAWETRAAWLRDHIRVSTGLLPEPERTPLKAEVFGKLQRDGYTVEKAYIESRPGFYATGNLFRPLGKGAGPFPAVACPHGHWEHGRLQDVVQARCISLARLGYVVFAWDMVGVNDSAKQVGKHRGVFPGERNELWGLSAMHLQSWNTIRAIDFLQSLADVDPKRIGLTGCSGGGTQTFMIMGIDARVTAAAPVCMISGIMQGGCECENAPLLRIDTCNIEIGALMAPRPMIMPSVTGDWTKETPKVEYPSIRGVYELYGAAEKVTGPQIEGGHGYPKPHRESVYGFFAKYLQAAATAEPIPEPPSEAGKAEDLLVWQGRDLPEGAKTPETLTKYVVAECRRQRDALLPRETTDRKRFEETLGVAYRHAILADLPKAEDLAVKDMGAQAVGDVQVARLLLGRKGVGDQVPAVLWRAKGADGKAPIVVVVHPAGKAGLIDPAGKCGELVSRLLGDGVAVLGIDTYLTGEHLLRGPHVEQKKTGTFFSTYNRTPLVERVQDILTALAYVRGRTDVAGPPRLIGVGDAGAWCLLAAPLAPADTVVVADLNRLSGDEDPRWLGDLFTPCILKAGDVRTAAALAAPRRMLLHNFSPHLAPAALVAPYASAGQAGNLKAEATPATPEAVAKWVK